MQLLCAAVYYLGLNECLEALVDLGLEQETLMDGLPIYGNDKSSK